MQIRTKVSQFILRAYYGLVKNVSLKLRLLYLIVASSIPLLVAITYLITAVAGAQITRDANQKLQMSNEALVLTSQMWLDFQTRTLSELAHQPDIISMDPQRQKAQLERLAQNAKNVYLVSTTDPHGNNVARSDSNIMFDYSDRDWVTEAVEGKTVYQIIIGKSFHQPALILSMPIRSNSGVIVGVAMLATSLSELSQEVKSTKIGETGYAYVIDVKNKVVAHPNFIRKAYLADSNTSSINHPVVLSRAELFDFSNEPSVTALKRVNHGVVEFTDKEGVAWGSYVSVLDNGWTIIVQQQREETLESLRVFQHVVRLILVSGVIFLLLLSAYMIHQALKPVAQLIEAVNAIAGGDLSRKVVIWHEDEIGVLSRAFNGMTEKLQDMISHLHGKAESLQAVNLLQQEEIVKQGGVEVHLRELAEIDQLTNIYNRRKLFQALKIEIGRGSRFGNPLSLIMFDLDSFKQFNDKFGHDIGDEVLKETVNVVSKHIRNVDIFARYGVEEFVVICTGTALSGAMAFAEKIREAVEQNEFPAVGRVTVSVGVTELTGDDTEQTLLKRVDAALYAAKHNGRNRVEMIRG
jgi:diguanylate cyclase (GGDEF)-like protein